MDDICDMMCTRKCSDVGTGGKPDMGKPDMGDDMGGKPENDDDYVFHDDGDYNGKERNADYEPMAEVPMDDYEPMAEVPMDDYDENKPEDMGGENEAWSTCINYTYTFCIINLFIVTSLNFNRLNLFS